MKILFRAESNEVTRTGYCWSKHLFSCYKHAENSMALKRQHLFHVFHVEFNIDDGTIIVLKQKYPFHAAKDQKVCKFFAKFCFPEIPNGQAKWRWRVMPTGRILFETKCLLA
jgi:hypothetical protein